MRRSALALLLPLLTACSPSGREQAALDAWFACTECNRGELDSLLAVSGFRAVRVLARQLGGPTDEELAAVRIQYLEEYRQLAAASPGALAETQDDFAARLLSNFVAERLKRAARALAHVRGPVNGWVARRALRNTLDFADRPDFADRYRPDVTAELRAARVTSLRVVAGGGQTAAVGRPVDLPPAVQAFDGDAATPGIQVEFRVTAGGGSVTNAAATTDAGGTATVGSWTLGPIPGPNALVAVVGNDSVVIEATALAAPLLRVVAGLQQTGRAGDSVATAPVVRALDAAGQAEAGVMVRFVVLEGGGAVARDSAMTDADGLASPGRWVLGTAGFNLLAARAPDRPEVQMRAFAYASAPVAIPP
jgi:hypothetical protein